LRTSEDFVVVSTNEALQQQLFDLLPTATDVQGGLDPAGAPSVLEPVHHGKWREESAVHVAQVEELVEHRKQSLRASHQARKSILEERITLATNEKIRLMKESELARAEADFTRRMAALEPAIQQADIRAELVAYGTAVVGSGPTHHEEMAQ
jgi:ATP-dependent helicase HepA